MSERRVDPDDGVAYTWEELSAFYKETFKQKAIAAYWEDVCTPVKQKKAKTKSEAKGEAKAKPSPEKPRTKTKSVEDRFLSGVSAFYTFPPAPAALIVDVFLREKGVSEDTIKGVEKFVDLPAYENRGEACKKMNPQGSIPWFVTSKGAVVAETIAMCEYIEDMIPRPPLIGPSATQRGVTRMWQRRMEEHFCSPATYAHRNWCHSDDCPSDHGMKNFYTKRFNAEEGSSLLYSQPSVWKDLAAWALNRVDWLERVKRQEAEAAGKPEPSDFICGDKVTMVDIQVYVNMFYWDTFNPGQHFCKNREVPWVQAWYDRMHARPAVAAARAYAGYKDLADKSDVEEK